MRGDSTEIVLVRHGQTEWNRVERFRGRADIPLNATGVEQARALAARLSKRHHPALIYCSPLGRCIQTAQAIAAAVGAEVRASAGLIDTNYGDWQGLTPVEVEKRYPDLYHTWLLAPQATAIPHGETLDQVRARAFAAMEQVVERHLGQSVVLVSHQDVCKLLILTILGLDNSYFWRIEQHNAAINVFERRGQTYLIKVINDTCHTEG